MVRSHCESHHSNGITDQKCLQQTSATKSAKSGSRAALVNQLICKAKDRRRDGKTDRLRGLEIDVELKRRRKLDREFVGFGALENLIDVSG
jgi:hypothetical protein